MNDLERDLIKVLRDQPPIAADPGLIDAVLARIGRQRKLRLAAASAAMALVVGVTAVVAGTAKDGPAGPVRSRRLNPAITHVGVGPVSGITALGSDVWIFNQRDDLIRIDSRTSTVTLRRHIRGLVSFGGALVSGDGRLWLATESYRAGQADVLAINPVNGHVTGRLNLGGTCYSDNASTNAPIITYGAGHLWISCWSVGYARRIVRIDPATGRVDATTGVIPGGGNEWIVAGQQGTWYSTDTTNITKVDPSGTRLTKVTVSELGFPFNLSATRLALGGGALWAMAASDESIAKIDPATGRVIRLFRDYDPSNSYGAAAFAAGFGSVWVEGAPLLRVSMRTGRVQARLGPAGGGDSLVISNDAVWIGTQSGVLRVNPARVPG